MLRFLLAILLAATMLSGCSTLRAVDTDVQSFSSLSALPPQAAFRFERLPSQQATPQRVAELESMAEQALVKAGLRRDDAGAHYAVQIGARVEREDRVDWPDAWWYGGFPNYRFSRLGPWSSTWLHTTPWFQREITLLMRDLRTGEVVYETHAAQEGSWSDNQRILPAMFAAALNDFPAAPTGVRKINIELSPP
jgi:predicted small secreted protein